MIKPVAEIQALLTSLDRNPCPATRAEASAELILAIQDMAQSNSVLGDLYLKNMLDATLIHIELCQRKLRKQAEAN